MGRRLSAPAGEASPSSGWKDCLDDHDHGSQVDGIQLEPTDLVRVDFGHTGLTGNGRPGAVDSSSSSGQPSDQSTVLSVRSMAQARTSP
jgi:hypothetical protein